MTQQLVVSKFHLKPVLTQDAVQVTGENIFAVAEWCGGMVVSHDRFLPYVEVRTNKRRMLQAKIGMWVVVFSGNFDVLVYTDEMFKQTFRPAGE